jgi:hypothetical protein
MSKRTWFDWTVCCIGVGLWVCAFVIEEMWRIEGGQPYPLSVLIWTAFAAMVGVGGMMLWMGLTGKR